MIGVVAALSSEAEILLEQTETFRSLIVSGKQVHVGRAFGKDVAVVICGVGKVNAALGRRSTGNEPLPICDWQAATLTAKSA